MLLFAKLALLLAVGNCSTEDVPTETFDFPEVDGKLPGPGSHQTNRCFDLNMTLLDKGKVCGSP